MFFVFILLDFNHFFYIFPIVAQICGQWHMTNLHICHIDTFCSCLPYSASRETAMTKQWRTLRSGTPAGADAVTCRFASSLCGSRPARFRVAKTYFIILSLYSIAAVIAFCHGGIFYILCKKRGQYLLTVFRYQSGFKSANQLHWFLTWNWETTGLLVTIP